MVMQYVLARTPFLVITVKRLETEVFLKIPINTVSYSNLKHTVKLTFAFAVVSSFTFWDIKDSLDIYKTSHSSHEGIAKLQHILKYKINVHIFYLFQLLNAFAYRDLNNQFSVQL